MDQYQTLKMTRKTGLDSLIAALDRRRNVVIQAHDFPDHDAVAAGFGLQSLLATRNIQATLCFSGRIQSNSLSEAIKMLEIPISNSNELSLDESTQIILVDGFIGNRNVSDLPGEVIGLVDHHNPPEVPKVPYWDIRTDYGSCSTIIFEYFRLSGETVPRNVATALLMGLMMDTAFMTRGVNKVDLEAFGELFFQGDWQRGSQLLKNSLSLSDLATFREALNVCQLASDFCFIPLTKECSPEVAALTADFFLNIKEIHFVVVLVPDREEYRFSVRSEDRNRPADIIIRKAIKDIGFGGGHVHMGGGSIPCDLFPGEQNVRHRFLQAMGLTL